MLSARSSHASANAAMQNAARESPFFRKGFSIDLSRREKQPSQLKHTAFNSALKIAIKGAMYGFLIFQAIRLGLFFFGEKQAQQAGIVIVLEVPKILPGQQEFFDNYSKLTVLLEKNPEFPQGSDISAARKILHSLDSTIARMQIDSSGKADETFSFIQQLMVSMRDDAATWLEEAGERLKSSG